MKVDYQFKDASKFSHHTFTYLTQVVIETASILELLNDTTQDDFLCKVFNLSPEDLDLNWSRLSVSKRNHIKHVYVLFLFLGRGYENVTKRSQTYNSHLIRGVHKFFFQYSMRRLLIQTHTASDKYPNNRIMYIEKDYIKLLDYSNGLIPKDMLRSWITTAEAWDFKLTQSETKLWFK